MSDRLTLYIRKTNNPDGPYATTQYVPVDPVGQMDVHPNGVKAINCDLDPGLYWLIPVDGDDRAKRRAAANEVSRLGMVQEAMEANDD